MVESVLMFTRPNTPGPSNMPTSRNTATSGIRTSRAIKPEKVPTARMMPNINSACLANSSETEDSIASLIIVLVWSSSTLVMQRRVQWVHFTKNIDLPGHQGGLCEIKQRFQHAGRCGHRDVRLPDCLIRVMTS